MLRCSLPCLLVLFASWSTPDHVCAADGWIQFQSLFWWTDADDTPPLITTSPAGTTRQQAGVLGEPSTETLFGGRQNDHVRSGFQIRSGKWLDACRTRGIEFDYLQLPGVSDRFGSLPGSNQIVARPFRDALTGTPVAQLASFPSAVDGSVRATAASQGFFRWGANVASMLACCSRCCDECGRQGQHRERFDFLVGYRGLRTGDRIRIQEQLTSPLLGAATMELSDLFATSNAFHGANLGLRYQQTNHRCSMEIFGNVGLGATTSTTRIAGRTRVTRTGALVEHEGGLLALASNSGTRRQTSLGAVFDVGIDVGYRFTSHITGRLGYTFLFWPDVRRAGSQIDPVVNPNLLPPALVGRQLSRPQRLDRETDFWAHGLNLGLEVRF